MPVHSKSSLIVILNDNDMSIAKPVGAIAPIILQGYCQKFTLYKHHKTSAALHLSNNIHVLHAGKAEDILRSINCLATLLVNLDFMYIGPVDGHDVNYLVDILENVNKSNHEGAILIHAITTKGKGL